mgnify:CR=1 FL=1
MNVIIQINKLIQLYLLSNDSSKFTQPSHFDTSSRHASKLVGNKVPTDCCVRPPPKSLTEAPNALNDDQQSDLKLDAIQ